MEEGGRPIGDEPPPIAEPEVGKFDLTQDREETRHLFGLILVGLFAVTVLGSLTAFFMGAVNAAGLKDILAVVIPPEVSLLGAVIGFYYGTKSAGGSA